MTNMLKKAIAHPLFKTMTVAILICYGLLFLLAKLGFYSTPLSFFIAAASFYLGYLTTLTRAERQKQVQYALKLFRTDWLTVIKWGIYTVLFVLFTTYQSEPSEPAVKDVLALVTKLGAVTLAFVPTCILIFIGISRSEGMRLVASFLRMLLLYYMALWLIGNSGDDLYQFVLDDSHNTVVGVVGVTIVWMALRASGLLSLSKATPRAVHLDDMSLFETAIRGKLTASDIRYASAHEAGHALVYAALGHLPAGMKITVNEHSDKNGVLGFVTGISTNNQLNEKRFAEWDMLVMLAGKQGELAMCGESTLGSSNDHHRWLYLARSYLANHNRGVFYDTPGNKLELEQNEAKLEALQAEQAEVLRVFFDMNSEVFQQLADQLMEVRTMNREDLVPFLSRVKLPNGFPLPLGPFETFATDLCEAKP